jgi:hypothetical protein
VFGLAAAREELNAGVNHPSSHLVMDGRKDPMPETRDGESCSVARAMVEHEDLDHRVGINMIWL